ncbi:phage tail tape measure protein [Sphingomonas sp. S17]|uniref:phage tail tape measure protein n=1 Tax=Sphingomonas sp. S17 TaxID=1007104 RepID=UPI0002D91B86|nr:phage tail tape measure protein [Sphingomonas sp. S17]
MSVKDESFRAAMATNRAAVRQTRQDFDRHGEGMVAAMQDTARRIDEAALRMVDSLKKIGDQVQRAGLVMTLGLTAPLGLMAKASKNAASDFQSAMNNVHSAIADASPEQLDKLRNAAMTLGPAFGKSANEAAGAIEALAKNGMDAADILSGGLESALKLGVLGQTDLGSAADATTDILQQFHLSTSRLPDIVNKVSGALDASKLSFDGYKDAIGMVGGIAGGLGYQFEDLNTALAAVIPLMTGGSDAGTSFKTFLLSLTPASKEAKDAMKDLKLEFFDVKTGSTKSLSDIAEQLNRAFGSLNQKSQAKGLTKIFGTDGMRVALALMKAGAKGIADVQAQIDRASADRKIEILMDGEAAATQRMASAWERLKIVIGEAGIIQAVTFVKDAIASMLNTLSNAPPWFYKLAVGVGVLAASIGPLTLAAVGLAKIALPLLALRLGPVALGLAAIINPIGVAIRLLGQLALQAGAATVIGRLGTSLLSLAGPIGLLVTGISLLIPRYLRLSEASVATQQAQEQLNADQAKGRDVMMQLATATGKARLEALAHAKALRQQGIEAVATARKNLLAARSVYIQERAREQSGASTTPVNTLIRLITGAKNRTGAAKDLVAANDILNQRLADIDKWDAAIAAAGTGDQPKIDMSFDDEKEKKKKKGRDAERDEASYLDELGRSRVEILRAQADMTENARARHRADMAAIDEDRAAYARQLELDEGLTDAKRAELLAQRDKLIFYQRAVVDADLNRALEQESYDLARAENEAQQESLRMRIDGVDNLTDRRSMELKLLDLQRQQEEADLDLILATKATASAEWANAQRRKGQLDGVYGQRRDQIMRNTEGPGAAYLRVINRSSAAMQDDVERGGVEALTQLNTGLTDAILGTAKLADAFENMGKRIIASLVDIAIQQAIIRPLANSLFGVADAAGNRSGGSLAGIGSFLARTFGGGRAKGGGVSNSEWYVVGEEGPELFAPGVSGAIVPNGGKGARAQQKAPIIRLFIDEGGLFQPRVESIAGPVSVQTVRSAGRSNAIRARQSLD